MSNSAKNVLTIVAIIFLLLPIMQKWPFAYHTLIRLEIFIASIYLVFLAMQAGQFGWMILFAILVILYNPIIPIHLKKEVWQIVEISGAAVFGISLVALR